VLIEKIKAAASARVTRRALPPTPTEPEKQATGGSSAPRTTTRVVNLIQAVEKPPLPAQIPCRDPKALILLGASTGGTEALAEILTALPNALPPIAIVQHIPPHFSAAFAQRLNRICKLEVREAVDGDTLVPGLALIAPGNFHMMIQRAGDKYKVRVTDGPMVWHQRPAVDILFKSAVEFAPHILSGVLTGMGKDGAEGLLKLREKGAHTFAQDEASCVVYGMPKAAWENGGAQKQLPLDKSAEYITKMMAAFPALPSTSYVKASE
jgi:two-component system chemotaxis response regulator CheB